MWTTQPPIDHISQLSLWYLTQKLLRPIHIQSLAIMEVNFEFKFRVLDWNDALFTKKFVEIFQCWSLNLFGFTNRKWINWCYWESNKNAEICRNSWTKTWYFPFSIWTSFQHTAMDWILWLCYCFGSYFRYWRVGYGKNWRTTFKLAKGSCYCDCICCFERHFTGNGLIQFEWSY